MAEGGYDPDSTNPFTPDEDADETTSLIPEEIRMKHRTLPWFHRVPPQTSIRHQHETSFMGETPSGKIYVSRREQEKTEIDRRIKKIFPNVSISRFFSKIDEYDRVVISLHRKNAKEYILLDEGGVLLIDINNKRKFPDELRNALGKTNVEIAKEKVAENNVENERDEMELKELRERRENTLPSDRERLDKEIKVREDRIESRNQENEVLEESLPLKERIKEIFKKYGFTAIAVATAIATVIGVIVSNLKAGLTKVAKGVGNGLKELGKKLGEILPGMVGTIASFIFRTAGEVIGFLAKNAWLLIVGLVVFAVEQFKNKKK